MELGGLSPLEARLAHAHDGLLDLTRDLGAQLERETPPMVVAASTRMRARSWGTGDVWQLPAGGWVAPRILLEPDPLPELQKHVQQLLDG